LPIEPRKRSDADTTKVVTPVQNILRILAGVRLEIVVRPAGMFADRMSAALLLLKQIDRIARELHTIDARAVRLDLKQIAEFARSADVAEFDIAHRLREIRVLCLARV
jgi:hypothetical protein